MDKNNNLPKFRGKFKIPLCKLWRSRKVYSINDTEDDNDWDKPGLINGNLPTITLLNHALIQLHLGK